MIYIVKVTTNKEEQAIDLIAQRAENKNLNVYAVIKANGLKGYVLMEAEDRDSAEQAVFNLPYVKGIIPKQIDYAEIENMIEPVVADIRIEKGDIVEILVEPFKREKAKVTKIDKSKEEVVIELLEAAVPIPITVRIDNVKVIRRSSEDDDNLIKEH